MAKPTRFAMFARGGEKNDMTRTIVGVALPALLLIACSPAKKPPTPEELATIRPSDPHLAQLYEHSCKACHAQPGSGAPMVHDAAQWDPRWQKGEDVLLSHVVLGFKGMPAGGQCGACTGPDYEALIRFLADKE